MNIVTGEKIQQLCDIYLGNSSDFTFNPIIHNQPEKHVYLEQINEPFHNPYRVFCYTHHIQLFSQKIHLFQNEFILVTHNSDGEIRKTEESLIILNNEKMLKWYGQNVCFKHSKLYMLPIGIANSQWEHGNLSIFNDRPFMEQISNISNKTNKCYFHFKINTNINKRQPCYDILINKLPWLPYISSIENTLRLSSYEFCICPQGHGCDTHRLWECLYLKVVPIMIKSNFTNILKTKIPMVILNNWDELDIGALDYKDYDFTNETLTQLLDFNHYKDWIF